MAGAREDFHKAGCRIKERFVQTVEAFWNLLAVLTPIALQRFANQAHCPASLPAHDPTHARAADSEHRRSGTTGKSQHGATRSDAGSPQLYVADAVCYQCSELPTLLEVVVVHSDQLLTTKPRQEEIEVVLQLLKELRPLASPQTQGQIQKLSKHILLALPQALLFAHSLEQRHEQAKMTLRCPAVALLGWA